MKKLFAMIMILCLLCGAAALATDVTDDETRRTTVSYIQEANTEFTVTIPPELELSFDENIGELIGVMEIELDAGNVNVANFKIDVTLKSAANGFEEDTKLFHLVCGEQVIQYRILDGLKRQCAPGHVVLSWINEEDAEDIDYANLGALAPVPVRANWPAGTYTDILTFSVSSTAPVAE